MSIFKSGKRDYQGALTREPAKHPANPESDAALEQTAEFVERMESEGGPAIEYEDRPSPPPPPMPHRYKRAAVGWKCQICGRETQEPRDLGLVTCPRTH